MSDCVEGMDSRRNLCILGLQWHVCILLCKDAWSHVSDRRKQYAWFWMVLRQRVTVQTIQIWLWGTIASCYAYFCWGQVSEFAQYSLMLNWPVNDYLLVCVLAFWLSSVSHHNVAAAHPEHTVFLGWVMHGVAYLGLRFWACINQANKPGSACISFCFVLFCWLLCIVSVLLVWAIEQSIAVCMEWHMLCQLVLVNMSVVRSEDRQPYARGRYHRNMQLEHCNAWLSIVDRRIHG